MKSYLKRLSLVAAALTLIGLVMSPANLQADDWNLKTYITVSQPFQVPGKVLEPNTKYVLKRLDSNSGTRNVVQVFNEDQSKLLAMFMAISDYRLEPTDQTVLTFMETDPGYAKPVQSWFYPGRLDGLEFIYSKSQKAEIAMHTGHSGKAETVQTAELMKPEETVAAPTTAETREEYKETEITPQPEAVQPAPEPTPAPEAAPAPAPAPEPTALPKTAGELPLLGLIGLACFGIRFVLRLV